MEESFRVRIDKVFGSLSSSSAASSLNSLWCLADDGIDTRSDRSGGEKEVSEPHQPSFPENDRDDLNNVDEEDEAGSTVLQKPDDYNDEEWEIKSSIGMDTTLDMEVCIVYLFILFPLSITLRAYLYFIFVGRGR